MTNSVVYCTLFDTFQHDGQPEDQWIYFEDLTSSAHVLIEECATRNYFKLHLYEWDNDDLIKVNFNFYVKILKLVYELLIRHDRGICYI